ncbi:MAG TPA: tRNA (N(6)-L-threonylcarbamoyladenosine(37)-C(2))-methylthiotransferase MtaB [Spirochaetaceae bacterium]|jgi:threonylcarbamoyladenosine tRNA methylthiotransferase MtaB|nr:tRNA (N(6)-L-threonylcarbamoyladenosine(37)-C(2))-methylthiotransferase MtaB [Spirochaetaceae bacterium]
MALYSVSFRTFGCRLNQSESENAAAAFVSAGAVLVDFDQAADLIVFNTCTVTSKAEQKARREMRLALRRSPDAVIVVTGCYAEMDPQALEALAPRIVVVPGSRKGALVGLASALADAFAEGLDALEEARRYAAADQVIDPFFFNPGDLRLRGRAALKVQDGCDNRCSYCRVCLARGGAIGLEPAEVLRRARLLAGMGYPEIVLTGVNLSQYRAGGLGFAGLLDLLCRETEGVAYRISSYEPDKVNDGFLKAFAHPRVQPFLHLAVQSGSDPVLRAMGRSYRAADALEAATAARAAKADPYIGADLILGFPGESDAHFAETMAFLRALEPAWVHGFTFSPRPGTKAYAMGGRVPERVAVERAAAVAALAHEGRQNFALRRVGKLLVAMAEYADNDEGDDELAPQEGSRAHALSAEYLKLELRGLPPGRRSTFSCRATGPATGQWADLSAEFVS